ncbi:hypothetical protein QJS10_CPA01g02344 [Acorus calamus]|uniref:Uncharacterized protein n=1 Tax=Acorus calamus TaxID=4465 RepID=A0AAV9FH83_ACOCL|nr:hypothetical protein QJS10_CPA01g02344 [Acorus calamus]
MSGQCLCIKEFGRRGRDTKDLKIGDSNPRRLRAPPRRSVTPDVPPLWRSSSRPPYDAPPPHAVPPPPPRTLCGNVDVKRSIEDGEKRFNQLSIKEQGKFDEETLVNANNIKRQSTIRQRSNGFNNEYIVDYIKLEH